MTMDYTSFNLIRQSVVNNSMTDNEKLLEEQRVTCEKKVPPMEFLFRVFGKPCFPRGELVGVTGKVKSGKTVWQLPVQQPVHQPIQQEMFNQSETD